MLRVYGFAAAVSEKDIMTDLADVWDKMLQLKDCTPALSFFAERRAYLLKQEYAMLEVFVDPCKNHQGYGVFWIIRTYLIPQSQVIWRIYVVHAPLERYIEGVVGPPFVESRLQCNFRACSQGRKRTTEWKLNVNKSIIDVVHGELWDSSQFWADCVSYFGRDIAYRDGFGNFWEWLSVPTGNW